jgi:hypothetical protein
MTMRTSLVIASLALAVWAGYLLSGNGDRQTANRLSDREGTSKPVAALVNPNTPEVKIDCKDGYKPPLCLTGEFKNTQDLTLPENGSARPAVAKDTIPGLGGVHRASQAGSVIAGIAGSK